MTATPESSPTSGPPPTPYLGFLQCAETICVDWHGQPCSWPVTPTPDLSTLQQEMAYLTADEYARVYNIIKEEDPSARVFCCGQYYAVSTQWWEHFMDRFRYLRDYGGYQSLAFDGIHVHVYPYTGSTRCENTLELSIVFDSCLKTDLISYWNSVHQPYTETRDIPLWITEYGYLYGGTINAATPTPSINNVRTGLMQRMVGFLASTENPGYYQVSWFSMAYGDFRTRLMRGTPPPPAELTILGTEWASYDSRYPPTPTSTPSP